MFGGIAAGADRLFFATFDGNVVSFDVESGEVAGQFSLYPSGPERVHVSVCAVAADGTLLLGDARARRVRRYAADGRQLDRFGGRANPSIEAEDGASIVTEPCAILPLDDGLVVACGGFGMEHGVQRFDAACGYRFSFAPPDEGWKRCQGLARLGDDIWVAETEGGAIRKHALDGSFRGEVDLHPDLRRPFRLAPDGYGRVLMVLAPESAEQQEAFGVARLAADGAFEGWTVRGGEEAGQVYCPFDLAVLPDGRFVVADFPLGEPPDVRLQLFSSDGRLLRALVEDTVDLTAAQKAWFERLPAPILWRRSGGRRRLRKARSA